MASSLPGALDYWLNLAMVTLPSDISLVWPNQYLPRYTAPLVLMVMGASNITHEWAELGPYYRVEEHYRIENKMAAYTGVTPDQGQSEVTSMIFDNLDLLTVALAQDYTLGGNVRLCLPLVEGELQYTADPAGRTLAVLNWCIHVEARITTTT